MLFLKILGVYYLWKIKRTKKVPLEAGRQGQESHCGAGGQEPWVGQPSLSFGAGKARLGDGKWRREETTAPEGPPPQVAPWFPPPAGLRDTARLHLQQGDLRALQAPCPVARPCSGPLFRAVVGRPLSWESATGVSPSCPLLAQSHLMPAVIPAGHLVVHTLVTPSACEVTLHPRPFPWSWSRGWATA